MTIVAFFDLDYTLLNASSGMIYVKESIKRRRVPLWFISYLTLNHRLGRANFGETHARLITKVGRQGFREAGQFFAERITPRVLSHLTEPGLAKIKWHQDQGHRVVIISASIEEIVKPVAEQLGLGPDYLCTRLAVEDDRYLGRLIGPECYGAGKVHWARQWLAENKLDFPAAIGYVYTDSSSDLPLLELAQHPVAVNPSRKLAKIAAERGWAVERFY